VDTNVNFVLCQVTPGGPQFYKTEYKQITGIPYKSSTTVQYTHHLLWFLIP